MGIYYNAYLLFGCPISREQYDNESQDESVNLWKRDKSHYRLKQYGQPVLLNISFDDEEIRKGFVKMDEIKAFMEKNRREWPNIVESSESSDGSEHNWWIVETMWSSYDPSDPECFQKHLPVRVE
jgi:hypothetical protein